MITETKLAYLWEKLKNEQYIVLRNYENILVDINSGNDIDLLCFSKEKIAKIIQAVPLTERKDSYSYYSNLLGEKILLDIREIGDMYYASKWEQDMIAQRMLYSGFFVADIENYHYSLLYHALVHKKGISEKYLEKFDAIFKTINKNELMDKLVVYMRKNNYSPVIPMDSGVEFNYKNYSLLLDSI